MIIKKICKRSNGLPLTKEEAIKLYNELKRITPVIRLKIVGEYPTEEIAYQSLDKMIDIYKDYFFAYTGINYIPPEGYNSYIICFKRLPSNFELIFPQLVIIG